MGLLLVALCALALIEAGCKALFGTPASPGNISTSKVHGVLAEVPEIYGGRNPRSTRVLLNEYPLRSFIIDGASFRASKWGMIGTTMHRGDTVYLDVATEDFKNNIQQVTGTPEEILPVKVYSFRTSCCTYLTIADYCKEVNDNTWVGVVCLLSGIALAVSMVMGIRKMVMNHTL